MGVVTPCRYRPGEYYGGGVGEGLLVLSECRSCCGPRVCAEPSPVGERKRHHGCGWTVLFCVVSSKRKSGRHRDRESSGWDSGNGEDSGRGGR